MIKSLILSRISTNNVVSNRFQELTSLLENKHYCYKYKIKSTSLSTPKFIVPLFSFITSLLSIMAKNFQTLNEPGYIDKQ